MSTVKNRRKWRNFLIRPSLQFRLVLVHILFVAVVLLILIAAMLLPLYFDTGGPGDLVVRYATAQLLVHILDRFGILVLLIVLASLVYQILFSHRVVGPLVNIGHTIDSVARGDLTRKVLLRRGDFLQDEALKMNTMLGSLESRIAALKASHVNLSSTVGQLPEGELKETLSASLQQNEFLLNQWNLNLGDGEEEVGRLVE